MKIKNLTFCGLGSYIDKTSLDVAGNGLVLIEGENGSGKSSIFDIICWILFDETIRGVKKGDWINTFCSSGYGKLVLIDEDKEYKIFRERSKDGKVCLKVSVNGKDISGETIQETQKKLEEDVLKYSFDLFRNTVMFGQNDLLVFTYGTDRQRKDLIGQLLGFNEIDKCLATCRGKYILLHKEVELLENELKDKKNFLESQSIEDLVLSLEKKKKDLEEFGSLKEGLIEEVGNFEKRLRQIEKEIEKNTLIEKIKSRKNDLSKIKEGILIEGDIDVLTKELDGYKNGLEGYNSEYNVIVSKKTYLTEKNNELSRKIKDIELLQDKCPYCLQDVDKDKKSVIVSKLESELAFVNEELVKLNKKENELQQKIRDLKSLISQLDLKIKNLLMLDTQRKFIEKEITLLENECISKYGSITPTVVDTGEKEVLEKKITSNKDELSKLDVIISNLSKEIGVLEEKINQFKHLAEEIKLKEQEALLKRKILKHLEYLEFLLSNKGVRNNILDLVIPFLNKEVNLYLQDIFPTISVSFSTTVKGKTVEEKRELGLVITDLLSSNSREFRYWSGGEKMLISLAIRLALWKMVYQFSEKRFEVLFLDEIFGCLDDEYKERVFDFLQKKQKEWNIPIFVVEHITDIKERFNRRIRVVKDDKGSHLYIETGGNENG